MGRPKDTYWWDCANKLSNGSLECKFCSKTFKGGVSRIKLHLSGKGGNIGRCKMVDPKIKEKAQEELREDASVVRPVKRVRRMEEDGHEVLVAERGEITRHTSVGLGGDINAANSVNVAETREMSSLAAMFMPFHNQTSSSSSSNVSLANVFDQLVKFFINRNVPVDVLKDSKFRSLLMSSVAHPGLQSGLQLFDYSAIIEKSLSNFEHEMNQYMLWVQKSWETTGCTLILYDLSKVKGKFSAIDRCNFVAGFYCPRGFIFVEIDPPFKLKYGCDFLPMLDNALKNHRLNLCWDEVVQILGHEYGLTCNFPGEESEFGDIRCFTYICDFCVSITSKRTQCWDGSVEFFLKHTINQRDWLGKLVNKTEEIYEDILGDPERYGELHWTLKEKDFNQVAEGKYTSFLCRLGSIMELKADIRMQFPLGKRNFDPVAAIVNDEEFWSNGKEVVEALNLILRILNLTDTLVPTACYFEELLYKAERVLKAYHNSNPKPQKFTDIWEGSLEALDEFSDLPCDLLDPVFSMRYEGIRDSELRSSAPPLALTRLVEEEERMEAEWMEYRAKSGNPFPNISSSEGKVNHPVKLWEKYGGDFPLLRKCAIKLFSRPGSYLCNQVEKCMSQLHGSDNYILQLNAMMMEEFKKLGDKIFQPVDVDSIINELREIHVDSTINELREIDVDSIVNEIT